MTSRSSPPVLALRAFEAAARNLSFTGAAVELHLTQGAISRQIRILEEFLGRKLFDRFVRRVELTSVGQEYYLEIQQALLDIERATQRAMGSSGRATLTLSVMPTLAASWLMPKLARFVEVHPHVDIRLITSIEPVNFRSTEIDVAIRVGRLPGEVYRKEQPRIDLEMVSSWKGVGAEYLLPDVLVPVMSRKLLARGPQILVPRDLLHYPLLHTASRKHAWGDWLAAHDVALPDSADTLDFGHFFMGLRAAQGGKGIAIVPSIVLQDIADTDEMVCPLPGDVHSAGSYYLLTRESKAKDSSVSILRAWLMSEASKVASRNRVAELVEAARTQAA
ncbi:MAG: LysR substrate-binding domain-containing protein [Caldimonas sp.]